MMKIVAFGGQGMVGSRVIELLQKDFVFVTPIERDLDITNSTKLVDYLGKEKPQIVINFAAVTDVDYCETERENKKGIVWRVNARAPRYLSKISSKMGFFLVHISTDMVFPGSFEDPGPYEESHKVGSYKMLTWYGASKAEAERGVLEENSKNSVIRIIYPVRSSFPDKLDYARKILKLYDDGKLYPMFTDQRLNMTFIDDLAVALRIILKKKLAGTYHAASADVTTPYEFASYFLEKARGVRGIVKKSTLKEFVKDKDKRRYPMFGGLKTSSTEAALGIKFSAWRQIVDSLASNLKIL